MSLPRHRFRLLFVLVLLISSLACGLSGVGGADPTATAAPTEAVAVAEPSATSLPPTMTPSATATQTPPATATPMPTAPSPTVTVAPEATATTMTLPLSQGGMPANNGKPYEVTFDDEDDWRVSDEFVGYVQDGVFVFSVAEAESIFWTYAGETGMGAGVYEVQVQQTVGRDDPAYGLILGVSADGDDFYAFEVSSDGYYAISKCSLACDEYESLSGGNLWVPSADVPVGLNVVHNLSVLVSSNGEMQFYDNDVLLETVTDPEFAGGDIGMIVETFDGADITVEFDNLRFTPAADVASVACANEDGNLAISHDGRYFSGSEAGAIYVASSETALNGFADGAVSIYVEAGPPEELDILDITVESDPARQLEAFLASEELLAIFGDVEIVQEVAPTRINEQRAAQAVLRLDVPGSESRYQLTIVVYEAEELVGVLAAFVPVTLVENVQPVVAQLRDSVLIGPAVAPVCQHVPAAVTVGDANAPGLVPIMPGQILLAQRQNRGETGRYSLTAATANELLLVVAPEDDSSDLVLRLLDPAGHLIQEVDGAVSGQAETTTSPPEAGVTYLIEVAEFFDKRSAYSLAIIDVAADSPALLDTVAVALAEDGLFRYGWNGVVGQPIVLYVQGESDLDLMIDLQDGDGLFLAYADAGLDGEPELILFIPEADGRVFFVIREFSGKPGTLTISVMAAAP